jgi:hypothetical protein
MKITSFIAIVLVISSLSAFAALDLKFNGTITMTPAAPATGANVTFSVNFIPSGAAVDNLKCTWGIDASNISERTFAHINAETPRTLSFNWVAAAGSHKVWFRLDPEKKTSDINTQNNYIEKSFTVSGSELSILDTNLIRRNGPQYTTVDQPDIKLKPKPDLVVSEITITPANPVASDRIVVKAVCKNIGTADSKPSHTSFKIYGEPGAPLYFIAALSPGATSELKREINPAIAQKYGVTVFVDYNGEVRESNEKNNVRTIFFDVLPAN